MRCTLLHNVLSKYCGSLYISEPNFQAQYVKSCRLDGLRIRASVPIESRRGVVLAYHEKCEYQ